MRWDDHARNLTIEPHEKSASKPVRPRRFVVTLVPSNSMRTLEYTGERASYDSSDGLSRNPEGPTSADSK